MLLIPCPWCGPRSQVEFTRGGDATVKRPATDAPEAAWFDYVYLRDNPRGPYDELWLHGAGCRRWFTVRRDTRAPARARPPWRRCPPESATISVRSSPLPPQMDV